MNGATHADFQPEEAAALDAAMFGLVQGWESNFKQLQLGVLGPEDIILPTTAEADFWGSAFMRELWAETRPNHSEEFAAFWEGRFDLRDAP